MFHRFLLCIVGLCTVASAVTLASYRSFFAADGDVTSLFPRSSPTLSAFHKSERLFGKENLEVIVVTMPEADSPDGDTVLLDFADALLAVPGVQEVTSPLQGRTKLPMPVRVLTPDSKYGRFLVAMDTSLSDTEQEQLNKDLENAVSRFPTLSPLRAGTFVASEAAARSVRKENARWTPLSVVALFIACLVLLHRPSLVLATLVAPFLTVVWVAALLAYFGILLNPLCQLVPPLLLAIGASYSVYVTSRITSHEFEGLDHPWDDTMLRRQTTTGLAFASVTTIIGFGALACLNSRAVIEFGVIMSLSTGLSAALALIVTPWLLKNPERLHESRWSISLRGRQTRIERAGKVSFVVLTALALVTAPGLLRLSVDTNPLDFLSRTDPTRKAIETAGTLFPGSHAISLVIESAGGAPPLTDPANLLIVTRIAEELRKLPDVAGVVSADGFDRAYTEIQRLGLEEASLVITEDNRYGPPAITTSAGNATRILIETDLHGRELLDLAHQVEGVTARILSEVPDHGRLAASLSSMDLIMAQQTHALVRGLLDSVVSALAVVGLLLLFFTRRVAPCLLGLLPSLFAIVAIFGAIGYVIGTVSLGTAMVAATALGMVSDNTFHYLVTWKALGGTPEAAREAQMRSFWGLIAPAAVLIGGFSVTDFSAVKPIQQFGLFLGLSLVVGTFCNAVVLPYLIYRYALRVRRDSRRRAGVQQHN